MAGTGKDGRPAPARIDWRHTATRRRDFLRVLAETYDVERALEAGKLTWPQVCELRVRHPDFASRFEEVIVAGYDRLEATLLRESGVGSGAAINAALAQALLKQRRAGRAEAAPKAQRAGQRAGPESTREQTIRAILDKMAPLKAAEAMRSGRDAWGRTGGAGGAAGAAR